MLVELRHGADVGVRLDAVTAPHGEVMPFDRYAVGVADRPPHGAVRVPDAGVGAVQRCGQPTLEGRKYL